MIETDPVHAIEQTVARAIAEATRRALGWWPEDVQVHFREDTIVYLLDGEGMPGFDPELVAAMEDGVGEAVEQTLGRPVRRPIGRTRLSDSSLLVLLRLERAASDGPGTP